MCRDDSYAAFVCWQVDECYVRGLASDIGEMSEEEERTRIISYTPRPRLPRS